MDANLQFPDQPRAELDKTIGELISHAEHVLAVQGRLRELLTATRSVIDALDIDRVLSQIVQSAMTLVGARYGALGVIDENRTLERFVHCGIPAEEVERIGPLPHGYGLLGAVIDSAETIRLAHITDDARSVGFPEHHPPMDAFLGVPILLRDEVYGNLYLTDPAAGFFTEEDEQLIQALASTAAVAIQNARLYDEARRQERLSKAFSEIATALLSPRTADVLSVVAEHVALVIPSRLVTIAVPADSENIRIAVAHGEGSADLAGTTIPAITSLAARAIESGQPITDESHERTFLDGRILVGPGAAVPLTASGRAIGALCVFRERAESGFTRSELATIAEFSAHAGIAVSLAWARADRQRLDIVEDRARIARDLHDHVIQRLFATSLGLQALSAAIPAQSERIDEHVSELDAAIADIRTAIFTLRGRQPGAQQTRDRILAVVAELAPALFQPPRVTFSGPVDLAVTGTLADDVIAVVRESLANVARHANAQNCSVAVVVDDAGVTVTVDDDGDGLGERAGVPSGTVNLAHRAADHGGDFSIADGTDRGTRAQWRVPVTS